MALKEPPWCAGRQRRSGAARRAQAARSQARAVQRLLAGFHEVQAHRGNRLSRLGAALLEALRVPSDGDHGSGSHVVGVPCTDPIAVVDAELCGDDTGTADAVAEMDAGADVASAGMDVPDSRLVRIEDVTEARSDETGSVVAAVDNVGSVMGAGAEAAADSVDVGAAMAMDECEFVAKPSKKARRAAAKARRAACADEEDRLLDEATRVAQGERSELEALHVSQCERLRRLCAGSDAVLGQCPDGHELEVAVTGALVTCQRCGVSLVAQAYVTCTEGSFVACEECVRSVLQTPWMGPSPPSAG